MNQGYQYEQTVYDLCNTHGIVPEGFSPAGSRPNQPDLVILIGGVPYNVELKLNKKAQMGGSSLRYMDNKFSCVGDYKVSNSFISKLEDKKVDLDEFLNFINKKSIPTTTNKDTWNIAKEKGLIRKINLNIRNDFNFIEEHYVSKETYYMQIGGEGLYYMRENPAGLQIPKLDMTSYLQIRLIRGSSNKRSGIVSVALRFQGRIKKLNEKSVLSLDNPESIVFIKSLG